MNDQEYEQLWDDLINFRIPSHLIPELLESMTTRDKSDWDKT